MLSSASDEQIEVGNRELPLFLGTVTNSASPAV